MSPDFPFHFPTPTKGWGYERLELTTESQPNSVNIFFNKMELYQDYFLVTAVGNFEDIKDFFSPKDDDRRGMDIETFNEGAVTTIIVAAILRRFVKRNLVSHTIRPTTNEGEIMISFVFKK